MAEQEHPGPGREPEPQADVRESFKGRITSEPTLGTTQTGKAKFYAKVEQRHWRYEDDGTYTRLPNTYHDLVAYKGVAVRAYKNYEKNDFFIAEGRMEDYRSKSTGQMKQRFVATAFGHNMAHTDYEVDRTPRREQAQRPAAEREAASRRLAGGETPAQPQAAERQTPEREAPAAFAPPEHRSDRQPPAMGL
ncbi:MULTISPECIES: single-stranded DNA-binding protein [unclassified Brevibacterium]|uniref:single-stranded DNA-binding protein n=1 Tax=Micrococcales TaxID=85006 RepID=UPI00108114CE|nr:single-stranded DNA-binding protein [Brevibacterium sp. S111]MDN6511712.1 single-stranded DNA-binding protein [Corynebacterium sp.]TGD10629.1 single-stranded DNA-binding protein [Brevibacterium sp. S111]